MASPTALLTLEGLHMQYPGRPPLAFADRQLAAGAQALLLGPSGSGKSTLLQLIAGLRRPTAGQVHIAGHAISAASEAHRDRLRGRFVGLVFQRLHLLPALTVADNLRLARQCAGLPADEAHIAHLLDALGLAAHGRHRPQALSQGQQQRVAIARALVNRPALVLADEPSASLDDAATVQMLDLLCEAAAGEGAGLLIATHDQRVQARIPTHWRVPA